MRCRLAATGRRAGVLRLPYTVTLAGVLIATAVWPADADILHLKSGGSVEGRIIEQDGSSYRVRTIVGTVTVPADGVDHIEKKPSVLEEHERLCTEAADTPAAQVELARWCEEQGLRSAWRKHLQRALELDPDFAPARSALGFVRVAGMWVEGRTVVEEPGEPANAANADDRQPARDNSEQMAAAIQSQWTVRIRSIRQNMLESSLARLQREGREKIAAVRDPLALLPLARVLSPGNSTCREVLVEALARFEQDEATMNLAILALADADENVRRRALVELARRNDPRIVPQFRRALASDNDPLIRRAAIVLGTLQATAAVPELIDVLKAQRRKLVEVPVRRYFGEYPTTFDSPTVVVLGGSAQIQHLPMVGIESLGSAFVVVDSEYQMRDVTVFRTEVLEALKTITGENFGFDAAAWRRWYEEQQP